MARPGDGTLLGSDLTYLSGIGERRARLLAGELSLRTLEDLILYFPYKYLDRTQIYPISQLTSGLAYVQLRGRIVSLEQEGQGHRKRLRGYFSDGTGMVELVWFNSISYWARTLRQDTDYILFGQPKVFKGAISITHPDIEMASKAGESVGSFFPLYHTSERMKRSGLDSKALSSAVRRAFDRVQGQIPETLPGYFLSQYGLMPRAQALYAMHFPTDAAQLEAAQRRLKLEELFYLRLRMRLIHAERQAESGGFVLGPLGDHFMTFYEKGLTFELTGAQKRVLREIREDVTSGHQMNRLLQGDVGSGKTVVALLAMIQAVDSGMQACMMAPTEILAQQHYNTLTRMLRGQQTSVALLTGSMRKREKERITALVEAGEVDILVGTHILIQDYVRFHALGMAVIDEQHRFGVYQRSRLWEKNPALHPHILIMSATPIPRTLAMTMYGDLDVSVLDELPPGRTPIKTSFALEKDVVEVRKFLHMQLREGRQVYIVYPLIEESEKSDLKSLEEGYDETRSIFPSYQVGMVHGKMKAEDKEEEMRKFAAGETQILVATTVIEVGVDVPNATVMVITAAERFGLSQLHQLRGRVGRGDKQSYCILRVGPKAGATSMKRIQVMCDSTDGFYIAEQDMALRGYGELEGTQQSGTAMNLRVADLSRDVTAVTFAAQLVDWLLKDDPTLSKEINAPIRTTLAELMTDAPDWGQIS